MSRFYVTTPLYYVNDRPHIGHAYTTVAADVVARWHRLQGKETHFLTGTDEHGQKVYLAAQKRGMTPQEHVDDIVKPFQILWEKLNIQYDDFIRTTEERHTTVVQAVLQKLYQQGDIYADNYEGWYSTSEERFWTDKDLVDGKCPLSGNPVEWLKEKNYFFKMSKYADALRDWINDHPDFLRPISRRNEVLGYLRKDVGDLCISRPKKRLPWGIQLPFDEQYVTYVWFDALLNYITGIGYHPQGSADSFEKWWPANYQIMGKDILTTHSVYWSTMLFSLGLTPANTIFAHGWWTVEGRKMGKSIGNVVDPHLLIDNYGVDTVRFFLLREFPFGGDGNFNHDALMTRYNSDLANDLGNLAHRTISMITKWLQGSIPPLDESQPVDVALENQTKQTFEKYQHHLERLEFSVALEALWTLIRQGNKYVDSEQPWRLNKEGNTIRLGGVMRRSLEICRLAANLLSPIMPNKSQEMLDTLRAPLGKNLADLNGLQTGAQLVMGKPVFPRIKELPKKIKELRNKALGIEPQKPKAKDQKPAKIKIKIFQKVPFQSAVVETVKQEGDNIQIRIHTGTDSLVITGSSTITPPSVGSGVVLAGPATTTDFQRITLQTGVIQTAKVHPEATKLLLLTVDIGETAPRNIVAGIANRFTPEQLIKQSVTIVSNLKPSKLRGAISEGMIMAAGGDTLQSLVVAPKGTKIGTKISRFGNDETGILLVEDQEGNKKCMTFSEATIPGAIVR